MSTEYVVKEVNVPDTRYEFYLVATVIAEYDDAIKDKLLTVSPDMFANLHLGLLWGLVLDLIKKDLKVNAELVHTELLSNPQKYSDTTRSVFCQMLDFRPSHSTLEAIRAVNEVINSAKRRELAFEITRISKDIANPESNLEAICSRAQNVFNDAVLSMVKEEHTKSAFQIGVEVIQELHDSLLNNKQYNFLLSGFNQLDAATHGFRPSSYNIIAGRPGAGKTAFALNIMTNIATTIKEDKPVLFFSLEMDKKDVMQRVLCSIGDVSLDNLLNGIVPSNKWVNITRGLSKLTGSSDDDGERADGQRAQGNKFYICDKKGMSASEIWTEAKRIAKPHDGLSLIVIDYIQLVKAENPRVDINQQIKESNQQLLCMAQEFGCPLLVLSQLNRDIERRSNKAPTNADLRDSGALEADASLIMFLWKDGQQDGQVTLSITKQRHGPANVQIPMQLKGECFQFTELGGSVNYR